MKTLISMLFFLVVSSRALASCDSMDGATCKQESDSATLLQVQAKTHVNEESQEEYQEQNEEDDEEGKEDGREKANQTQPRFPGSPGYRCVYDYGGTQVRGQSYGPNANDCCPKKCRMCGQYACMQGSPWWKGSECCPTESWPECGNGQMAPCKIMSKAPAAPPVSERPACTWTKHSKMYSAGYAKGISRPFGLEDAKKACFEIGRACAGVTCGIGRTTDCTLRGGALRSYAGEDTYTIDDYICQMKPPPPMSERPACTWTKHSKTYSAGYADGISRPFALEDAKKKCFEIWPLCAGVTCPLGRTTDCTLRAGALRSYAGEDTYTIDDRICQIAGGIIAPTTTTTTTTTTSASAGSEYSVMKTSSEYCGGTSLSAGASTGEEECKGRCSEEPKCKFMSFWKTGGLNYCLLTETCDSFITQSWHEIVIFEKPL